MKLRRLCLVLCICVFTASYTNSVLAGFLAVSSATLSGRVTDPNGLVIAGAKVDATNVATNVTFSSETNGEGFFVISNISPGRYRVTVEKQGFQSIIKPDVEVHVQDTIAVNFAMQVGSIVQSVMVEGGAPLVKTETAEVSTLVDRQFVENLPLNGRSFQSLIALTPGVVLTQTTFGNQGQFSVNGQRASANYFSIDGVSANAGATAGVGLNQAAGGALPALSAGGGTNSLVSVDAMQEFKVQTSTFAPEFGRTPGAQVQIATRSGTNEFRGTVFEYFRNDALDANDWFANSRGLKRPALRQNDFGGVVGGPLYLPRFGEGAPSLYSGKSRTFFFFSYEGLRLRLPRTQITLVPSVTARQAAVPRIQPFLNAYPIPNGPVLANGFAEFSASYSDPSNLNATSIRVDHSLNEKLSIFGRYSYSPSKSVQRAPTGVSLNSILETTFKTQTLTLGLTHSLTSKVSNEIRANYSRSEGKGFQRLDSFGGAVIPSDSVLFPSFAQPSTSTLLFNILGGRRLDVGLISENLQRQVNVIDNLSIFAGAHQLKFGVDYRLLRPVVLPPAYSQIINFQGVAGAASGIATSATVRAFESVPLNIPNFSAYGQDTWKVTSRLTLTYGLRWDINPAPKGRNGKDLVTFENIDNPTALRLAPNGTPLYETTYNNFAPRVGLVYRLLPKANQETVLRGGFGVFYDIVSGQVGNAATGFPFLRTRSLSNVPYPLTSEQATPPPFSLVIPASGSAFVADRNLNSPFIYQWNVSLEQSLGSNQTLSASYIGAAGRRLLKPDILRVLPAFLVGVSRNNATSDYHAMQLQFQRRLSRGFQALASYTWAHSIDSGSNDTGFFGNPSIDSRLDRGNSDFDVRHAFNAAVTYNIPSLRLNRVTDHLSRNWSVDAITTTRSATPVNLIARIDFTGGFQTFIRPDLVQGVSLYTDDLLVGGGRRFNRAAFIAPPAGRQGTLGRNVLRSFPVYQVDLALRRQFNLTERLNLQLRAEAFNLFNHPNFGDPGNFEGNFLPSPLFGQSTRMLGQSLGSGGANGGFNPLYQIGGPRSIQLAVKIQF